MHQPLPSREHLARGRALRAARAVTLTAVALALGGCGVAVTPEPPDLDVAASAQDATPRTDAVVADGATCGRDGGWEAYQACCDANGWDWRRGCEAWGPFAPPEMAS